jgi:hypothetical protein
MRRRTFCTDHLLLLRRFWERRLRTRSFVRNSLDDLCARADRVGSMRLSAYWMHTIAISHTHTATIVTTVPNMTIWQCANT